MTKCSLRKVECNINSCLSYDHKVFIKILLSITYSNGKAGILTTALPFTS